MTMKVVFWTLWGMNGKTTLALGLARALIRRQKSVAIVDKDPGMKNNFHEIQVLANINEELDINIIDCPPALNDELLAEADMVVIPYHCCNPPEMEEKLSQHCDPRKTVMVPTWFRVGDEPKSKHFKLTKEKLRWQQPENQDDLLRVSEELADAIMGLKVK